MMRKILNGIGTAAVALVVAAALFLLVGRFFGIRCFTVLSGSMEPTYKTGSLLCIRRVDPLTLHVGDVITFLLDEDTVATHRIVQVYPDGEDAAVVRFETKGDANEAADGQLVHSRNVLGTPLFSVPLLGYAVNWIRQPPGLYIAFGLAAAFVLAAFLPDILHKKEGEKS